MASRKRARTSSNGGGSSDSTAAALVELDGGEPCPSGLVKLWRSGRMTDTVVEVEGRSFAAHKNVLAAQCDFFNRHYDHGHMRDADHPKLLEHVTAAAFEPLLAFLYEGKCTFDESLLAPVLRAANYLNVEPLERAAVGALTERLTPSNALTAWTWGEELKLPELAEAAKETALEGFDEVEQIEEATLAQMQALVADEHLAAKSEEVVFSAVAQFAEAKQPAEADLHDLLRNVRFPLMSQAFLMGTVRNWSMLDNTAGQRLLFDMMASVVGGPPQQPREVSARRVCFLMGSKKVQIYHPQRDSWTSGPSMLAKHEFTAAATLGGKIYVIGGRTTSVEVFDPKLGAWSAVAPLPAARAEHTAAAVGGKLYVFCGVPGSPRADSFDPQTGAWTEVANPTTFDRAGVRAVALRGKIYLTGGYVVGTHTNTSSLEVYDPQTDTWAAGPPMRVARAYHGMAVLGDKIFVAGGTDDPASDSQAGLSSVEVFDPSTESWSERAPMMTRRSSFTLTALQGKLLATGGEDDDDSDVQPTTIETYDPKHNLWQAGPPIPPAVQGHGGFGYSLEVSVAF